MNFPSSNQEDTRSGNAGVRWIPVDDAAALSTYAAARILGAASRAIEERGRFLIVLAGGDTPLETYKALARSGGDWMRWHLFYGDERCLPTDDMGRNSRKAGVAWLDHSPIPAKQVHEIPAELGPVTGARAYADTLRSVDKFDLVLLGLGEDGHTASLFPGQEWGAAVGSPDTLAVFDAPKPPPQRISLSVLRLGRTREALFLVEHSEKLEAVRRWRLGDRIPARAIQPASGVDVLLERCLLEEEL